MPVQRLRLRMVLCILCGWLVSACSPTLDWRVIRPEGTDLQSQFPCKPAVHARKLDIAGAQRTLTLHACEAGEAVFALAWADGVAPTETAASLQQWRGAAAANIGAAPGTLLPVTVTGATPNPESGRVSVRGRRPDGSPITQDVLVFTRGTQIFQATVLSGRTDPVAVDQFFSALRFGS